MDNFDEHLSRIQTHWSELLTGSADQAEAQRHALLLRYYRAAFRYLLGVVRDPEAAEELAQDFAVRFLRGDFRRADQSRGRFRDLLKTALRNLARDYWRRQRRAAVALSGDVADAVPAAADDDSNDAAFDASWREELLARTWEALAHLEQETSKPYFAALRLKVQHPEMRSPELAALLGQALGKDVSADGLRQTLHRARRAFGALLVREVELSLEAPDVNQLEAELIELRLLEFCRAALRSRSG